MKLDEAHFTVFDVETTGLYPYSGDKICEIAAIRYAPKAKRLKKFHTLIDPQREISYGAFSVNGITEDMVRGQPKVEDMMPQFMKFIEGSVLVAYNAGFDLGFIECALGENIGNLAGYYIIDALRLARRLFVGLDRYNLGHVSEHLGISSSQEHRAMSDAEMTRKLFNKELQILRAEGVSSVEEIAFTRRDPAQKIKTTKDYKIVMIEAAICAGKKMDIYYKSAWSGAATRRIVTPKEIREGYDKSYLIAYCHEKNGDRNFRIDCITDLKVVE